MSLTNRNETRLLVENWRKVLKEGLQEEHCINPNLLNERQLIEEGFKKSFKKLGSAASKAITAVSLIAALVSPAEAKLKGLAPKDGRAVQSLSQHALGNFELSPTMIRDLIELNARIQSKKTFKPTKLEKMLVEFCIKQFDKMARALEDDATAAMARVKKADKAYEQVEHLMSDNPRYQDAREELDDALESLRACREAHESFHEVITKFSYDDSRYSPTGSDKTWSADTPDKNLYNAREITNVSGG